jgi:surface protein
VTNMSSMFGFANAFNQDIGNWNVSAVTDMSVMFDFADAFNQDLSLWCVTGIDSEPFAFGNSTTPGYNPAWGTCPAAN